MILKEQKDKKVYSDGQETEQRLLNIAKNYPEDSSQDYIANNSEYIVNNTFSSVRQNILNWYPFKENAEILEVGAGMGSLTGMLCDKAKRVVSIEMSEARAAVIKARYPKRTNLEIISADITEWKTEQRFDYVVFIGVLEYAGVFSDAFNPYERFLDSAKNLLKENGVVLFAIENRFGLKYWIGGSEDHLQMPFAGIEGYKEPNTPKTFSKKELENMLEHVGLQHHRVYSVYPDYKFPEIICTDEFAPSYMNMQKVSFTYSKNSTLTANEKELYKDVIENNVWEFFANSYLVEASQAALSDNHVIHVSAKGECKKQYRANTVIYSNGDVVKMPVHSMAEEHIQRIYNNNNLLTERGISILEMQLHGGCLYSKYTNAQSAQKYFVELLEHNDFSGICNFVDKLKKTIMKSSDIATDGNIIYELPEVDNDIDYGVILKDGFIDMTLYNAFYENEEFIFYDQEWRFQNVPLNFILYYGIKSSYTRMQVLTTITLEQILEHLNIEFSQRVVYDRLEDYIWSKILYRQTDFYGEDGYCNRYSEEITLDEQYKRFENDKNQLFEEKQREIAQLNDVINQNNQLLLQKDNELLEKDNELLEKDNELKNQVSEMQQKDIQINNQHGHIEQLLEVDRHYQNIINSRGWKLVSFPGRVIEKILPVGTPRRQRVSMMVKYVKAFNWNNIKFVCGAFKKGGFKQVKKELNDFEYRMSGVTEFPMETPEIVESDEIKSLDECEKLIFKKYQSPTVSIVIPVYNQFTYTYNCLKSILQNSGEVDYEIIIADDVSTDLTTRLSEVAENINIVRNKENQRFLRNCNNAAKHAKGKYILFLNNDTQVQENWLQPLVDLIERDDTIGMVGSKLIYPDGTLQEAGGIIWGNGNAWNYGNGQNPANPEFNYVKEVDYISGAAIMIRTSLWKEIGGFDEYFAPAYCEDSDLAFEVRKHGYKLMYQPLSVVVHFEGKSNGTDLNSGVKKYQIENMIKLQKKWKDEFEKQSPTEEDLFHAKDRSQQKETILIIDHYVPQFDKDAGSRTIWQYINMFISKGYNVKFMGDNFYQDEPYTTALQQIGVEVLYGPWYAQNYKQWIIDNKDNIDYAFLNRPHITEKYIDFLKEDTNIKCIYYGCDLHCLRIQREYELNHDEKLLQEAEDWKKREYAIMRKTDVNYYPSCVEVEEIHRVDPSIPAKTFDIYVYEQFRENIPMDFAKREGIMFVGGFAHPPNTDAVLWFVKNVYPIIKKKLDIPFYIVGSNPPEEIKRLHGNGVVIKGFVSDEELAELYNTCKMVVVPLRFGAGVKGKVIEALYYGIPMITTSIGIEGIQGAEKFVEIADDADTFASKVESLYKDDKRLVKTVNDYQNYVKECCSIDAVWNHIKEDFSK